MFKFKLGEQVKVQVLDIITNGEIVSRNSVEKKKKKKKKNILLLVATL